MLVPKISKIIILNPQKICKLSRILKDRYASPKDEFVKQLISANMAAK
ncbi:hypothetical protein [Methanobacterium lacus]|nr:hypothetical protein [Methanobacterium lacus]